MEEIKTIIQQNPELFYFSGKKDASLVVKAEETLGIRFPESYKNFLMEYGMLGFEGKEYYGIIDSNFFDSGIPDGIWFNLLLRREDSLPPHLFAVYDNNGMELVCLDTSNYFSQNECGIAVWDTVHKKVAHSSNVSFRDYLLEVLSETLEDLEEDE